MVSATHLAGSKSGGKYLFSTLRSPCSAQTSACETLVLTGEVLVATGEINRYLTILNALFCAS